VAVWFDKIQPDTDFHAITTVNQFQAIAVNTVNSLEIILDTPQTNAGFILVTHQPAIGDYVGFGRLVVLYSLSEPIEARFVLLETPSATVVVMLPFFL